MTEVLPYFRPSTFSDAIGGSGKYSLSPYGQYFFYFFSTNPPFWVVRARTGPGCIAKMKLGDLPQNGGPLRFTSFLAATSTGFPPPLAVKHPIFRLIRPFSAQKRLEPESMRRPPPSLLRLYAAGSAQFLAQFRQRRTVLLLRANWSLIARSGGGFISEPRSRDSRSRARAPRPASC